RWAPIAQVTCFAHGVHCTTQQGPMAVGAAVLLEPMAAPAAAAEDQPPHLPQEAMAAFAAEAYSGRPRDRHEGRASLEEMTMTPDGLAAWRKRERERLIAAREALDPATVESLHRRIDGHLERSFPGLAAARLGFCWPIRNEYDARPLAQTLRDRGAVTALPVVVAPRQPLVFREWHSRGALVACPLPLPH